MAWEHLLLGRWFAAEQAKDLEQRLAKAVQHNRERRVAERERIAELEGDIARVALLARALAELCLRKGVLTHEELVKQLAETDFADGVFDAALDPQLVEPGKHRPARASADRRKKPR